MNTWLTDLRYAARILRKNIGLTFVIVLVLAIGIGANTTIFSVVNPFLLRPLPYEAPDELLHLFLTDPQTGNDQVRHSLEQFRDWREQVDSFSDLAVYHYTARNLTGVGTEPEQQIVGHLSANLLPLLGVEPSLGRGFASGEDRAGADGVAILSDELWQRRYGAREDILGSEIRIDDRPHTVIGVMAPRFHFPYPEVELWTPLVFDTTGEARDEQRHLVIGRLAEGISAESALSEIATLHGRLGQEYPEIDGRFGATAVPLRKALLFAYDQIRLLMVLLMGAVGFVLLIVTANVANILLARAGARASEVAIRTSLGADRRRLVRQFLTESGLLALLGGGIGAALAFSGVRLIDRALPDALYRVGHLSVDTTALVFTLGTSLLAALFFGLVPAFRGTRVDLVSGLKEGGRGSEGGKRGGHLRGLLVVSQLSLAVVLLSAALLLIGGTARMQSTELGFAPERSLTLRLTLPEAKYGNSAQTTDFFARLTQRLETLPSVDAAAAVHPLPLSFSTRGVEFAIPGREPSKADERLIAHGIRVTPSYFEALPISLRQGRTFDARDTADSSRVVVINAAMAERFWPTDDPIGRTLRLGGSNDAFHDATVIGVVDDVRDSPEWQGALSREQIYRPLAQAPIRGGHLVLRSAGSDPMALAAAARQEIRRLDPALPVSEVMSMNQVLAKSVSPIAVASRLLSGFAAVAMFLATVGIYGVVAYTTSRRHHELGIRQALGADRGAIVRLVLRQGTALAVIGVGLGLAAAFGLSRLIASQLPGIADSSSGPLWLVGGVLGAVTLFASYLPARRAARIDPLDALRSN